jgi:hypothetical protein
MAADAVEITTFYLRKGLTIGDFIAANADVDAWLRRQHGFMLRRIWQDGDGLVTDMLLWQSVRDGERAASGVVTELADSPVHDAIDHATVSWSVRPCLHGLTADGNTGAASV